ERPRGGCPRGTSWGRWQIQCPWLLDGRALSLCPLPSLPLPPPSPPPSAPCPLPSPSSPVITLALLSLLQRPAGERGGGQREREGGRGQREREREREEGERGEGEGWSFKGVSASALRRVLSSEVRLRPVHEVLPVDHEAGRASLARLLVRVGDDDVEPV